MKFYLWNSWNDELECIMLKCMIRKGQNRHRSENKFQNKEKYET